ncbi:MAG TPA: glycosyltransferase family 9 protein [Thermoanaerobaculia bacterium]
MSRDPERLLVVRTSALGDIVHGLPVLAELRRRFPAARLGWVVDEAFAQLLAGHAQIDRLFAVPLRRWRRARGGRRRELVTLATDLRAFRADVALDLMGNHKGALLALLSGAPRRVGHARGDRREPASALWLNERIPARGAHAVESALSLLDALGAGPAIVDFSPASIACGRDSVPPGEYVYLHPGAAWGNKRYPPSLWGEVAAALGRDCPGPVLVGAAPGEEQLAAAVVAASRGAARVLPAPTLDELVGAVRGARLVLAGDTGAAHLARAFDRPLVVVHGPTDPAQHGPWSDPDAVVVRRLPCSFCHQRMEDAKSCLRLVAPDEIVARARHRLAAAPV